MKLQFELTLVTTRDNNLTIDKVVGKNLTELLGQFLLVLAKVHKDIVNQIRTELKVLDGDDDIPF